MQPVTALSRQLQLASTQASASLARLAIDVYGTIPALQGMSAALGMTSLQAQVTQMSVGTLTSSLGAAVPALEQTNTSLQQTIALLDQMQALNWLSESLLRVEEDAERAQQAIDDTMLPAFDRAYASFFDLADAAIGFQRTVADVLSNMSSATVIVPGPPTLTVGTTGTAAGGNNKETPSWLTAPTQDRPLSEYYKGITESAEKGEELVAPLAPIFGPKWGPIITTGGRIGGGIVGARRTYLEREERQRRESFRYMSPEGVEGNLHNIESALRHREDALHNLEQGRHNLRVARQGGRANTDMIRQRERELRQAEAVITWTPESTVELQEDYQAYKTAQDYQRGRASRPPQPRRWTNEELYGPNILRYPVPERPAAPGAAAAGTAGTPGSAGVSVTAGTAGSVQVGSPVVVDMQIARSRMPAGRREVPTRSAVPGRAERDTLRGFQDEARNMLSVFQLDSTRGDAGASREALRGLHGRISAARGPGVDPDLDAGLARILLMMERAVPELTPLPEVRPVPGVVAPTTVPYDPANFQIRGTSVAPRVVVPPPSTFDTLVSALGEAGRAFYQTVSSAAGTVVANARGLAGNVGQAFSKGWGGMEGAKEMGAQQVTSSAQAFTGLLSSFTPLGMVATLLQGVFEGLAPLIESLKEPLRIVGTILGAALAPILKALFPLFKQIAIAATWVGQIFFTVAGGIAKVVGSLIKGLGKLIDKIPGMSDMGLVKAGQNMIDMGKGFSDSAKAMKEGREQIKELEFGETAEAAQQANEAMRNVPEGFKIAVARFQAAAPAAVTPPTGIGTASVPVGHAGTPAPVVENNPVTIQQVHIVSDNPEKIWHQLRDVMEREGLRHSGNPMAFAM